MRTFRVLGGGPLAGQVFYGKIVEHYAYLSSDKAVLQLDEVPAPQGNAMIFDDFVMKLKSGALVEHTLDVCSDLLSVDPDDLPALRDAWREARGEGKVS